jgi:aryl-alcohol dehydrogenase-like predicted oxidoreductase
MPAPKTIAMLVIINGAASGAENHIGPDCASLLAPADVALSVCGQINSRAMDPFPLVTLGRSELRVPPICLGTMTFGEQVDEATAHAILDRALERGLNFVDTAEMYAVPVRRETYGASERIIGRWFATRPGARDKVVLATKIAGPARNADWIRGGSANLTPHEIREACDASLARLHTDVIDLYQIHWPNRNVPMFGPLYFDPKNDRDYTSIHDQLCALAGLVQAGKIRYVGLSNETPWGLAEFVRVADAHGLPRVATVQNPYTLVNRVVDNGLDEMMHRLGVSLLGYSPLGFGALTGKYDETGFIGGKPHDRMTRFEAFRKQRWGRPEVLDAARRYNALAREHGLTPTRMALAFCYTNWRVASTIIGANTVAQLDENIDAWGTTLQPELLAQIDAVRWVIRDPAQ